MESDTTLAVLEKLLEDFQTAIKAAQDRINNENAARYNRHDPKMFERIDTNEWQK